MPRSSTADYVSVVGSVSALGTGAWTSRIGSYAEREVCHRALGTLSAMFHCFRTRRTNVGLVGVWGVTLNAAGDNLYRMPPLRGAVQNCS